MYHEFEEYIHELINRDKSIEESNILKALVENSMTPESLKDEGLLQEQGWSAVWSDINSKVCNLRSGDPCDQCLEGHGFSAELLNSDSRSMVTTVRNEDSFNMEL